MFVTILTSLCLATLGLDALEPSCQPVLTTDGSGTMNEMTVEKHCERGPRGHRGHRGHKGKSGEIGAQGPQGPAGTSATPEFGLGRVLGNGGTIQFPIVSSAVVFTDNVTSSSNVIFNGTDTFTILQPGTYSIQFDVKAAVPFVVDPGTVINSVTAQVFINGTPIAGSRTVVSGAFTPDGLSSFVDAPNFIIQTLPAGATVQLFVSSNIFDQTATPFYGADLSVTYQEMAYLYIQKIG